jgi:RimJ/RimL family protein N-acetyltransferase
MIRGERIYLAALDPVNLEVSLGWFNDPEVRMWLLTGHIPLTIASEAAFYSRMEASETDHVFEIHLLDSGRYIGNCGIHGVSLPHRTGEIGIVIGETQYQNQGYGRDALLTLLRFGFETLGVHRLCIRAVADNERAVHLYGSIGFTEIGRERQAVYLHGRFRDHIVWDMLEEEWRDLR